MEGRIALDEVPTPEPRRREVLVRLRSAAICGTDRESLMGAGQLTVPGHESAGAVAAMDKPARVKVGDRVAVVDTSEYRLNMAKELGAELALSPAEADVPAALRDWTAGQGVATGFECVGGEQAAQQALAALRRRGNLALVGVSPHLELDPWQLIGSELTIYASRNFNSAEFDQMLAAVQRGLPVTRVVTHRFALSQAEEAFSVFRSGRCGKVLFTA